MSPDYLSEGGPAESTVLEISTNILLGIFLLLGAPYIFHCKHFFYQFLETAQHSWTTFQTLPRVETNWKTFLKLTSLSWTKNFIDIYRQHLQVL